MMIGGWVTPAVGSTLSHFPALSALTTVTARAASPPTNLSPALGGELPAGSEFGGQNPASPGGSASTTSVAGGIDPATENFSQSNTDLSAATYGNSLELDRTYDAGLAHQQA
ncbi:MAG TPA: hypothetical protein VFB34_03720, partial [Chloroflexota bacterium]|nr:hypothetical protein [Chloroflexota bacterium]